jgi:hypothetical protein
MSELAQVCGRRRFVLWNGRQAIGFIFDVFVSILIFWGLFFRFF